MNYARIEGGTVREIIVLPEGADPAERFAPGIVEQLVADPGGAVEVGHLWTEADGFSAPPAEDIAVQRDRASARIDAAAEHARSLWITGGDGQAMSYLRKLAEADDCLANYAANNLPAAGTYPLLESEVPSRAADAFAVATIVRATADQWVAIEAQINRTRVEAKDAIDAANDSAAIAAVLAGLSWPTPA